MTLAQHLALMICALAIAPALASVPPGDPFYVRHGQSVELAPGLKLKFIDVNDGRCPAGATCVWQGEAFVEVELQFKGQAGRGTITTEKPEGTVLAHRVKLLGVYPPPREGEQRSAKDYVAILRVADTAPVPGKGFATRDAALAAARHYVSTYARAANDVCADWDRRELISYVRDSSGLCHMIGKVSPTAHAFTENADNWGFYFLVDDPEMRTQEHESLYFLVVMSKSPKQKLDRVRDWDVVILPCEAKLLEETRGGCSR
jgi:hypothetical protein